IGYYYSRDAKSWTYGGNLFPNGTSLGSRTWSGSTFLTGWNDITTVYTAVGHTGAAPDDHDTEQRIAVAKGQIHASNSGVWFTGFRCAPPTTGARSVWPKPLLQTWRTSSCCLPSSPRTA